MQENIKRLMLLCEHNGISALPYNKIIIIPHYCFIQQLLSNLKKYAANSGLQITWAQFLIKQNTESVSINQAKQIISNIIGSWQTHKNKSLQCRLLSSFLHMPKRDAKKIKLFLKLRKNTCVFSQKNTLDEVTLKYEDIVGIVYKTIQNQLYRKSLIEGIKKLFISYQMTQPKIYSTVLFEYVLSMSDQFQSELGQAILKDKSQQKSEPHQSKIQQFESNIHPQNGVYRKNGNHSTKYTILQRKFNSKPNRPKYHLPIDNEQKMSQIHINDTPQVSFHKTQTLRTDQEESIFNIFVNSLSRLTRNFTTQEKKQYDEDDDIVSKQGALINQPISLGKGRSNSKSPQRKPSLRSSYFNQVEEKNVQKAKKQYSSQIFIQDQQQHQQQQEKQQKQQQQQPVSKIREQDRYSGYKTWLKMIESNKEFKSRMLKSSHNQQSMAQSSQGKPHTNNNFSRYRPASYGFQPTYFRYRTQQILDDYEKQIERIGDHSPRYPYETANISSRSITKRNTGLYF